MPSTPPPPSPRSGPRISPNVTNGQKRRLPRRPASPTPSQQLALLATSSSDIGSVMSTSWVCQICHYKNIDPHIDTCAMCGGSDAHHLEAHRHRLKLERGASGLHGRSRSSWIDPSWRLDGGDDDGGGGGDDKKKIIIDEGSHSHKEERQQNVTRPTISTTGSGDEDDDDVGRTILASTSSSSSADASSPVPVKAKTSKKAMKKGNVLSVRVKKSNNSTSPSSKQESNVNSIFRSLHKTKSDDKETDPTPSLRSQKPRHDSFDEDAPVALNQRPPKSPSTRRVISSGSNFAGFTPLPPTDDKSQPASPSQASVTSSTVAVRGGFIDNENHVHGKKSPMSSFSTATFTADGDNISVAYSEAEYSYSSQSTVKHSNAQAGSNIEKKPKKKSSQRRLYSSGPEPERSNSTPMVGQSYSSDDGEDLRTSLGSKPRQFTSAVYPPIQEDREQVLSPPLPPHYTTTLRSTSDGLSTDMLHLVPPRLDKPSNTMDGEHGSLAPSFSSGVSSSAAVNGDCTHQSQKNNSLYYASNSASCTADDQTSPSDTGDFDEENQGAAAMVNSEKTGKRCNPCVMWSVGVGIIVLSVGIVLLVLALSDKNDNLSTFDMNTASPAAAPADGPPPFDPIEVDEGVTDPLEPLPPPVGAEEIPVQLVAKQIGRPFDQLGSEVAIGGPLGSTWIGMHREGFVRVESLEEETSEWSIVASLIPAKGAAKLAMSADAGRIAIVEGNGLLSIRQVTYSGQDDHTGQWDVLESFMIANESIQLDEVQEEIPLSVSFSSSGRFLAHASITTMPRGTTLSVAILDVRNKDAEDADLSSLSSLFTQILDPDSSHDFVRVAISEAGDRVAVCTPEIVLILEGVGTKMAEVGTQPSLPFGAKVSTCDISGNGLTIAVSLIDAISTNLFSYRDNAWEQTSSIPLAGTTLSLDYNSNLIVVGDGAKDNGSGIVTIWSPSADTPNEFSLFDTLLGGSDSKGFGTSLALSRRPSDKNLLVVGAPQGGKENEGAVQVYEINN